jgi:hypothetical protein
MKKQRPYGITRASFWTHPKIRRLSDPGKVLAHYLLTSPHTNAIGCFYLPASYIQADLQWPADKVAATQAEVAAIGFAHWCADTDWVLIPNFLKHNPIPNGKVGIMCAGLVEEVPRESPLFPALLEAVRRYGDRFPDGFLDRMAFGIGNGIGNRMPYRTGELEPEPELEPDPEPEPEPQPSSRAHTRTRDRDDDAAAALNADGSESDPDAPSPAAADSARQREAKTETPTDAASLPNGAGGREDAQADPDARSFPGWLLWHIRNRGVTPVAVAARCGLRTEHVEALAQGRMTVGRQQRQKMIRAVRELARPIDPTTIPHDPAAVPEWFRAECASRGWSNADAGSYLGLSDAIVAEIASGPPQPVPGWRDAVVQIFEHAAKRAAGKLKS